MSRAARLLELIALLRRYRAPVAAEVLAKELGVSVRTIYRDVDTLRAEGATIAGEPGLGYQLEPGFLLPPLMFGDEELEALVLGLRLCAAHGDESLGKAAEGVLAKVRAVLPRDLRRQVDEATLFAGPPRPVPDGAVGTPAIRRAIRDQRKVEIAYVDERGGASDRTIWPIGLAYFERARLIVAWCEARTDFRSFRVDRIAAWRPTDARFDRSRRALLAAWRAREGLPDPAL